MLDVLKELIDSASRRAAYADARYVRTRRETVALRNGALGSLDNHEEEGIGVRVRVGGSWGFAASRGSDPNAGEAALRRALALAEAQPRAPGRPLASERPARGSFSSPVEIDPFSVSLEDRLELLAEADALMRAHPGVSVASSQISAKTEEKAFASTDGAACEQRLTECGGGIQALAVGKGGTQVRSYPGSHSGHVAQAGYEHVLALDLPGNAWRVAVEAASLLDAPPCPAGRTTLVLAGEQLALQIHESVGHAIELDRVLGDEASYAGTSFVPADGVGTLRYGSEHMGITADATIPGALGSFGWDDEGVGAQTIPIVREGILRGFLSSRESAGQIGLSRSGGCMRAEGFARQAIVRMTNVGLDPGEGGSRDELIGSTDRGILIETNRSWSIDSRRLHFQFAGEAAWEIVDGRVGRLLRDPVYSGTSPVFWAGLDAVCSAEEWRLASVTNCGKGEPGQLASVSHGCSPARFRDVQIGSG